MGLETGTYISDLVSTNPVSADPKSQGDDHIRLIKSTVQATFPNVTSAVTPTHTELNYVDGVTSAIQGQLDLKAPLESPSLTGTPTTPTAETGTSGTQIASLDFVIATSLAGTLPGQAGNAGKVLMTNGTDANWSDTLDTSIIVPSAGTAFATTTGTESLSNKSLTAPIVQDSSDTTKKANFILSGVTAGQNRNITVADENMTLFTPAWKLLGVYTATNSASVDIESELTSTYDVYKIVINGVKPVGGLSTLVARFKIGGSYLTTTTYSYITDSNSTTTGQGSIVIVEGGTGTTAGNVNGEFVICNVTDTSKYHHFYTTGFSVSSSVSTAFIKGGWNTTTGTLTGIRFFMNSQNITGTFRVFGMRNS